MKKTTHNVHKTPSLTVALLNLSSTKQVERGIVMSKISDSDDELVLSTNALAALQEFALEQEKHEERLRKLYDQAIETNKIQEGIHLFKENWQLSQFWYSDDTANTFADALLEGSDSETVIVVLSAPSVFAAIQKKPKEDVPTEHIYLLEYDKRFELLADKNHFIFYNYKNPLDLDKKLLGKVDRLIVDPPFLNKDCQSKMSITAKALLAPNSDSKTSNRTNKRRLISCTGERMSEIMADVYPDTKITTFLPEHENGLSNEFRCYANFECAKWSFTK